jgi:hypothetical protein
MAGEGFRLSGRYTYQVGRAGRAAAIPSSLETSSHVPPGGVGPMPCLTEIIRPHDPALQRFCRAVEDARVLIALEEGKSGTSRGGARAPGSAPSARALAGRQSLRASPGVRQGSGTKMRCCVQAVGGYGGALPQTPGQKCRLFFPRNPNLRVGTPLPCVVAPFAACVAQSPPRLVIGCSTPVDYGTFSRVTA